MRQPRTSKALYPLDPRVVDKAAAKANQACHSCKRQKRKCDKAMPSCSLCTRMSRPCDYSDVPPAPTAEDIMSLQLKLFELESRLNSSGRDPSLDGLDSHSESLSCSSHTPQLLPREPLWEGSSGSSGFPSTVFLDRGLFRRSGSYIPRPLYSIPSDILQCIGDRDSVQQAISDYFDDIHPWLPMVTKKRMNLDSTSWDGGIDLPLLYLTMKLITSQPRVGYEAAENYLYTASKRFLSILENTGTASILHLQALILVALYEYGQGIYPAAWMTVGQCVRYADFLGLPSYEQSNDILGQCETWVEVEERRRTWWAVYVLDKLVCLGSRKRSLYSEPPANEIFPVDDDAWELGDINRAVQGTASSPFSEPQSTFGRMCQGALLVSRMLEHSRRMETSRLSGEPFGYSEVVDMTEAAHELTTSIQAETAARPAAYFSLIPAQCLAYSAVMKTLDIHDHAETSAAAAAAAAAADGSSSSSPSLGAPVPVDGGGRRAWTPEGDHLSQSQPQPLPLPLQAALMESRRKAAAEQVRDEVARDLLAIISRDEEMVKTSPFVLDAAYSAAAVFLAARKDGSDPGGGAEAEAGLAAARKLIARLSGRWRLGAEYLGALDHMEMSAMIGQQPSFVGGGGQGVPMVPLPSSPMVSMPTIVC